MTVYATCGHEIELDEARSIGVLDNHKYGTPCISFMLLCEECYQWYKEEGLIVWEEQP